MGFPDIHECSSGYGLRGRLFNAVAKATAVAALALAAAGTPVLAGEPVKILALGDSLTAGYGLAGGRRLHHKAPEGVEGQGL